MNIDKEILNFERDIEVTSVKWLWYPYIPLGKITILQGNSGVGKTMLALNVAAALSRGDMLPGDTAVREPTNIIYNTAEDSLSDTIKPRLLAAGADCSFINNINERLNTITMTDERLELSVSETNAKLLILDPIRSSTRYVSYKDIKSLMSDLKKVYQAINEEEALNALLAGI